jgi:hypothetical protein
MPQLLLYTSFILVVNGHHACLNVSIGLVGGIGMQMVHHEKYDEYY